MAVTVYRNIPPDIPIQVQNALQTGLVSGGVMSVNSGDSSKLDIKAGVGFIVDNFTDPENPIIKRVTWADKVAETLTDLYTDPGGFIVIGIDENAEVVEITFPDDIITAFRQYIILGGVVTTNGTSIFGLNNIVVSGGAVYNSLAVADLSQTLGSSLRKSGSRLSANGANLRLDRAAGEVFTLGVQFKTNLLSPNIISTAAATAFQFLYAWKDGSGGFNLSASLNTDLDPSRYDDGTGGTSNPNGTVPNNKWSVQRVYFTQVAMVIHYGQDTYEKQADAVNGIITEQFEGVPNVVDGGLFLGWIIIKQGITDISNSNNALIVNANRFGAPGA